jgi:hypothetical protein
MPNVAVRVRVREVRGSNLSTGTAYSNILHGLPQYLEGYYWYVGQDLFHLLPFQFVIY